MAANPISIRELQDYASQRKVVAFAGVVGDILPRTPRVLRHDRRDDRIGF
jgi:hypothetical protein